MISAVLFDYGGTLVKAREPWEKVKPQATLMIYKILLENGLNISYEKFNSVEDAFFDEFSEVEKQEDRDIPDIIKYTKFIKKLLPGKQKKWYESIAWRINSVYWEAITKNYALRNNAYRTIEILKSMGLKTAVVSNHHNHQALLSHLHELGLTKFLHPIISSCQYNFRKPDPRIFNMCLSELNVEPINAVYVGDTPEIDAQGAKNAGLFSILIIEKPAEVSSPIPYADRVIHDLDELPHTITTF